MQICVNGLFVLSLSVWSTVVYNKVLGQKFYVEFGVLSTQGFSTPNACIVEGQLYLCYF